MATVTQLPSNSVILDLDSAERPEEEVKEPFVVMAGGREITLTDPSELDWKDLAAVNIPADLLHIAMSTPDRKHLLALKIPAWKFGKLMSGYYEHYGLEDKIRMAKQQAALSGL